MLNIQSLFDGEDDVLDLRYAVVLQNLGVRHWNIYTRDSDRRGVKVIESRTLNKKKRKEREINPFTEEKTTMGMFAMTHSLIFLKVHK